MSSGRVGATRRGLLLAAATMALAGCDDGIRTIRYRLTLEVSTPEGLRRGSGVIEERVRHNDGILHGLGAGPGIAVARRGEAVVVDLGARGLLFCLLRHDDARRGSRGEELLQGAFPIEKWGDRSESYLKYVENLAARRPIGTLPLAQLPLLARFTDIGDPKTAERVDVGNVAAAFGPGVELKGATLEVTRDDVTLGIERRIGWIGSDAVSKDPGWSTLPYFSRQVIIGLSEGVTRSARP